MLSLCPRLVLPRKFFDAHIVSLRSRALFGHSQPFDGKQHHCAVNLLIDKAALVLPFSRRVKLTQSGIAKQGKLNATSISLIENPFNLKDIRSPKSIASGSLVQLWKGSVPAAPNAFRNPLACSQSGKIPAKDMTTACLRSQPGGFSKDQLAHRMTFMGCVFAQ